jgi:nitrogen fixation protein NifT
VKVMVRRGPDGAVTVYVPKKDLEEPVVAADRPELWGGTVTLGNGWRLALPELPATTRLPITVEATRVEEAPC